MQGSNDTHTLSCSTVATIRCSPEKVGCQKRWRQVLLTARSVGPYLASTHQMAPPKLGRTHLMIALLPIYQPRKDERLSWPGWLTCSGRFTHIVVTTHPSAAGRAQDRVSSPAKDRRSANCATQPTS